MEIKEIVNIIISSASLIGFGLVLYLRYKDRIKLGLSFDKWAVSELSSWDWYSLYFGLFGFFDYERVRTGSDRIHFFKLIRIS